VACARIQICVSKGLQSWLCIELLRFFSVLLPYFESELLHDWLCATGAIGVTSPRISCADVHRTIVCWRAVLRCRCFRMVSIILNTIMVWASLDIPTICCVSRTKNVNVIHLFCW
jgi:hypothetical protein